MQFVDPPPAPAAPAPSAEAVPFEAGNPDALPPLAADAGLLAKASHYAAKARLYKEDKFRTLQPWAEFFDRSKFSVPSKMQGLTRVSRNYGHFHSNYVCVVAVLSSYILITNFVFMSAMAFCAFAYYWFKLKAAANEPITILGREFGPTQAYALLVAATLLLFYFTNGSSTVFWLVTSAAAVVLGHAATHQPPEEIPAMFQAI
jgi:hypothetical protein